jgi:hypothetical protein
VSRRREAGGIRRQEKQTNKQATPVLFFCTSKEHKEREREKTFRRFAAGSLLFPPL